MHHYINNLPIIDFLPIILINPSALWSLINLDFLLRHTAHLIRDYSCFVSFCKLALLLSVIWCHGFICSFNFLMTHLFLRHHLFQTF